MDWNKLLEQVILIAVGALLPGVGYLINNKVTAKREERDRLEREREADLNRKDQRNRLRDDALIKHLRGMLDEMRDAEAEMVALVIPLFNTNWIIPDLIWQEKFMRARTKFENALRIVEGLTGRFELPEAHPTFLTEAHGPFADKTRMDGFPLYQRFMEDAEQQVIKKIRNYHL